MTQPELPDMGDPTPRDGYLPSEYRFHRNAMVAIGLLSPWVFLYAARTHPGLLWIPVLNLLVTYAGVYVLVRRWRGRTRRLYVPLAGVVVCWIVCVELFRALR
ncbi:hypothetical protein [Streptomyces chattanoogensis]|nr:hypothetical protein [Streptomyces chattanoogensis]